MQPLALLPPSVELSVDGVAISDSAVDLFLRTTSAVAVCPLCGRPSHHVHSRYVRHASDLPYQGRATTLHLTARRFVCKNKDCPRAVFCERLPDLVCKHARSTTRLVGVQRAVGFALGGEPGSCLSGEMGMPTSATTLLRRVKQAASKPVTTPRVLGVDDWAWRKGLRYGTILVDLERGEVIDLLPSRDGDALKQWLLDHPGVEVISRDRASAYAQAASEAAPDAVQVADRWHLLKNIREMLERFFERHRSQIKAVAPALAQPLAPQPPAIQPPENAMVETEKTAVAPAVVPSEPTPKERAAQTRATSAKTRLERFQEVRRRHAEGESIRLIGKQMGLSRGAVRRYLRQDHCPDWRPGQARPNRLDRFRAWIDEQLQSGRRNAVELHQELEERGYDGGYDAVRRFLTRRLAALGKTRKRANAATCRQVPTPSARSLSYDLIRSPEKRAAEQQGRVNILAGIDEPFREVLARAEELAAMLRKQSPLSLEDWLEKAEGSAIPEVTNFAKGIRLDEAAVSAAISQRWSNGPVEGAVNRLKTIKRQMYGRAGFTLLRARVLHAG
jgi:transposase